MGFPIFPEPEIAIPEGRGRPWTIRSATPTDPARINPLASMIVVPLGATAIEANVRAHEQIHGRISRRTLSTRIAMDCQQSVEDYRVHTYGVHVGIDWSAGLMEPQWLRETLLTLIPRGEDGRPLPIGIEEGRVLRRFLALGSIAVAQTGTETVLEALLDEIRETAHQTVLDVLEEARRVAYEATCRLTRHKSGGRWVDTGPVPSPQRAAAVARWLDRILSGPRRPFERVTGGADTEEDARSVGSEQSPSSDVSTGWRPWGLMKVVMPPRPIAAVPLRSRGGWRVVESGMRLRRPHRLVTDGRVFGRKKRERFGTVLVDQSGSMHLTTEDVERFAESVPAGTVATYSARVSRHGAGELRVVLAGKRRVEASQLEPYGKANCVDGPALRWLSRQRGPRVWVSDGIVTVPPTDTPAPVANVMECGDLQRRFQIIRVPTLSEAIEYLRKGGARRVTASPRETTEEGCR